MKQVFHDSFIVWTTDKCYDILFEHFHEIWKFWKPIFIIKGFPIEFVFMLD